MALLENAVATGGVLAALIVALASVSGAHFNPVISLVAWRQGAIHGRAVPEYVLVQLFGGAAGAIVANLMFGLPPITVATTRRSAPGLWLGEAVATFGLVLVAFGVARNRPALVSIAVAGYIVGAYFFTSSTSFANPAVTTARVLSDTFAGIAPSSVTPFLLAQLLGGALGLGALAVLFPVSVAE